MAEFDFIKNPPSKLQELWQAVIDLLPQLRRRVVRNFTIGTIETPVAHGLGFAPQMAHPVPHADARVWRTSPPSSKCVYFAASTSVVCDIEIVP